MKPDFSELIQEHNQHGIFLDKKGLTTAMEHCYNQGVRDGQQDLINWLSKLDYLSDNINYILEEWENLQK